jgi:peptidoglycan hydrolase-like protein with peptidoglycan-binding domain
MSVAEPRPGERPDYFSPPQYSYFLMCNQAQGVMHMPSHPQVQLGDSGNDVKVAQQHLIDRGYSVGPTGADGIFGHNTEMGVRHYQIDRSDDPHFPPHPRPLALQWPLAVDGVVGRETWGRLDPDQIKEGSADHRHVYLLQRMLKRLSFDPGPIDGVFGPHTTSAVKAFQAFMTIKVDGIVGPITWKALRS